MTDSVPIKFKDDTSAVRSASNIYTGNLYTPVREYVSNGIDAGASVVSVRVDAPNRRVYIEDDGSGIVLEKLRRIPQELGFSEKKPGEIGEMALGILSYNGIGSSMELLTRTPHMNGTLNYLRMDAGQTRAQVGPVSKEKAETLGGPFHGKGTRVVISNITPRTLEYLTSSRLQRELARTYNPLLVNGSVVMAVTVMDGVNEKEKFVEAVKYPGTRVLGQPDKQGPLKLVLYDDRRNPIMFTRERDNQRYQGSLEMLLQVNPGGANEVVTLYHNGVRICALNEVFEDELFCGGKLTGFINENFLPLNSEKTGYVRAETKNRSHPIEILVERLMRHKPELQEAFDKCVKDHQDSEKSELKGRFEKWLGKTYHEMPAYVPDPTRIVTPEPAKPATRRKQSSRKSPYEVTFKPFDIADDALRVLFDPMYRQIVVNETHPDYRRFAMQSQDEKEKNLYIAQQIAKGAAMGDFLKNHNRELGNGDAVLKVPDSIPLSEARKIMERESHIFAVLARIAGIVRKLPPFGGKK